jgi:hypothetical protein
VELYDSEPAIKKLAADGSASAWTHRGAAAWFAGIEEGRCLFGADARKLATPDLLAGVMAHEVAHAYRRAHRLEVADRQVEEPLTDLTTVFLGFGLLTTNASYRFRKQGELLGAYTRTEWSHEGLGYLSPQEMSFLLAAQAVLRGLPPGERRRIAGLLETNQAAFFKAACAKLDRDALIERLGRPPPSEWPPVVAPAPRPFPTGDDPPLSDPAQEEVHALRTRFEGLPVFRVGETSAGLYTAIFGGLGLGAGVLAGTAIPWWGATVIGAGLLLGGRAAGKRRRRDRCSEWECRWVIPAESVLCPGCGGTISGRIAHPDDRLEARERLASAARDEAGAGEADGGP